MLKIDGVDRFLPVSHVRVGQPVDANAAAEGALWRTMRFDGPGPMKGSTIMEHIYVSPADGEIRFVGLDAAGAEGPLEVVNAMRRNPLRIEYFQRRVGTDERVEWPVSLVHATGPIDVTVAMARAADEQAADCNAHSAKA